MAAANWCPAGSAVMPVPLIFERKVTCDFLMPVKHRRQQILTSGSHIVLYGTLHCFVVQVEGSPASRRLGSQPLPELHGQRPLQQKPCRRASCMYWPVGEGRNRLYDPGRRPARRYERDTCVRGTDTRGFTGARGL